MSHNQAIICSHCGKDPGPDPRNNALWFGFLDTDTGQDVCKACKIDHYRKKQATEFAGMYSETPIVISTRHIQSQFKKKKS